MNYIKKLHEVSQHDVATVGGKTASLGEMLQKLTPQGIRIPDGFAITAAAYRYFINDNNLEPYIREQLARIHDFSQVEHVTTIAQAIRTKIEHARIPEDLAYAIVQAYQQLSKQYKTKNTSVAVRSSATAEDLPNASFAGQQDTYVHIRGMQALLEACKKCFASLFNARAIVYRHEQKFDHFDVALSICVQQMVRSDRGASGVAFTIDTETGFSRAVMITAAYGLGESIVQGMVNPDEYALYKDKLGTTEYPVLQKRLGNKQTKMVYAARAQQVKTVAVPKKLQQQFVLSDAQLQELAAWCIMIEQHYRKPMDIEWAVDGVDKKLYIVQARPETVYGAHDRATLVQYRLKAAKKPAVIVQGVSVGQKIVSGRARIIKNKKDLSQIQQGDILVTQMTDPDWVPVMKRAAGIVTDLGGRTCHAAIVSRELGVPAVIGTNSATKTVRDGQAITLDCSNGSVGYVYAGVVPFDTETIALHAVPKLPCQLLLNLADPEGAFAAAQLPVNGVGLARIEFIMNNFIGIHPQSIVDLAAIKNKKIIQKIKDRACAYKSVQAFFVETLAQGVSMIAAAFYPRPVIVRLSDFKSNEYRDLLGGEFFEPHEENPMLGWRGASRYTTPAYEAAFALECAALKKVRDRGFKNMKIMVPFVRTVAEAEKTCQVLAQHGLVRGQDGLELLMMVEIPSNVLLLEKFAHYFDGFSIGSNDLTQLTLGVDRDSGLLTHLFDERDEAVQLMLAMAIQKAHAAKKYIGICGQAPSDYPEIAEFLIAHKIDSISLNKDAVMPFVLRYQK